jgi:hypothetical protein
MLPQSCGGDITAGEGILRKFSFHATDTDGRNQGPPTYPRANVSLTLPLNPAIEKLEVSRTMGS